MQLNKFFRYESPKNVVLILFGKKTEESSKPQFQIIEIIQEMLKKLLNSYFSSVELTLDLWEISWCYLQDKLHNFHTLVHCSKYMNDLFLGLLLL